MSLTSNKWVWALFIAGALFWLFGSYVYTPIMAFAGGVLASVIMLLIIHYLDDKLLGKVDTYTEIVTEKNFAYALYFASVAFTVVAAFGFAFLVFLTFK